MAPRVRKTVAAPSEPSHPVADYRFDAARKNIPPAGLAAQGKLAEPRRIRYDYDPHRPPLLRFDTSGAADRLPTALLYALALWFGMTHGYANGTALSPNLSPTVFILGLIAAALLATGYGLVVTDALLRLKPAWPRVAVRVAGSWVAAVGILVLGMCGKALGVP